MLAGGGINAAACAVGGGAAAGQQAVVVEAEPAVEIVGGCGGVIGGFGFKLHAPALSFGNNVGRFDGADGHGTAHTGFHASGERGAFFHHDAAENGGVEIVALAHAVVVHPDIHGLLGAVERNGDAAFAGNAADIGRDGAACGSGVHVVYAVEAFEHVACGVYAVALQIFFADIRVGDVFVVHGVAAAFIGIAAHDNFLQLGALAGFRCGFRFGFRSSAAADAGHQYGQKFGMEGLFFGTHLRLSL